MPHPVHITAQLVTIVFIIGATGCAISIPIIAWKFVSVLFQKDSGGDDAPDDTGSRHKPPLSTEDASDDHQPREDAEASAGNASSTGIARNTD